MIRIAPSTPSLARATPVEAAKVSGARSSQTAHGRNPHPSPDAHAAPSDSKAGNSRTNPNSGDSVRSSSTGRGQLLTPSTAGHPETTEETDQTASEFHGALNRALAETVPAGPAAFPVMRSAKNSIPAHSPSTLTQNDNAVPVAPPAEEIKPLPFLFTLGLSAADTKLSASKTADTKSTSGMGETSGSDSSRSTAADDAKESLAAGAQAFSARIQHTASSASPATMQLKKDTSAGPETPASSASDPVGAQPQKFVLDTSSTGGAAASTAKGETLASASNNPVGVHSVHVAEEAAAPAAAPEPVRDISFQLPGARGLEVRVSDRAGELRVDVRSADPILTQDLRANLHELVNGLEKKGFVAEVSHSGERAPLETSQSNGAGNSKDQSGDGQQGAFDREQQQRQQQAQQRRDGLSAKARGAFWADAANFNMDTKEQ